MKNLLLIISMLCAIQPAQAVNTRSRMSLKDKAQLIDKAEKYLNSLTTIEGDFSQTNPTSSGYLTGKFYMSRPGKMLVKYQGDCGNRIVSDGTWLTVYDGKTKQSNATALKETPANLLLQEKIDFSGKVKVLHVKRDAGTLRIVLTKDGDSSAGFITFVFAENPMTLKQWIITDTKGNENRFTLINPKFNTKLAATLFQLPKN